MSSLGYASIPAVQQYLRLAHALNLDVEAAIDLAQIPITALEDENGRIEGEQFQSLLKALIDQSADPLFGLKSANYVQPGSYSALGYLVMSCATIGEAIEKIIPFEKLVGDMGTSSLEDDGDTIALQWHCKYNDESVTQHMIDNVIASWFRYGQWLANDEAPPKRIELRRSEPSADLRQKYIQVFNSEVVFQSSRDAIVIDKTLLNLPLRQPDKLLKQTLENHAQKLVEELDANENSLSAKISFLISRELKSGQIRKENIADILEMNPRTMQRRLASEGHTYQQLLDNVRQREACRYLKEEKMGIDDIALKLGFADTRSFHRRFKTWMGQTPGEYRETS